MWSRSGGYLGIKFPSQRHIGQEQHHAEPEGYPGVTFDANLALRFALQESSILLH
jgi:hypothetical protein